MYGLVLCVVLFLPNLVLVFRASLARYYPTLSKISIRNGRSGNERLPDLSSMLATC